MQEPVPFLFANPKADQGKGLAKSQKGVYGDVHHVYALGSGFLDPTIGINEYDELFVCGRKSAGAMHKSGPFDLRPHGKLQQVEVVVRRKKRLSSRQIWAFSGWFREIDYQEVFEVIAAIQGECPKTTDQFLKVEHVSYGTTYVALANYAASLAQRCRQLCVVTSREVYIAGQAVVKHGTMLRRVEFKSSDDSLAILPIAS